MLKEIIQKQMKTGGPISEEWTIEVGQYKVVDVRSAKSLLDWITTEVKPEVGSTLVKITRNSTGEMEVI